jgi:LDH2 family malate/lactate/ureidoglycolate dehydrogenase
MAEQGSEIFRVVPQELHDATVQAAYESRGYGAGESAAATRMCAEATRHGIRTHNALKALHLDELFGSGSGGCVPGAEVEVLESRFAAVQAWDGKLKLGQAVAVEAMETCIRLADQYGSGTVAVDNAFHYLWGGGYVMDAAKRGYVAYTNCTSTLAEVVPFGGKFPTLGTNPHSWGFPTMAAVGYPVVIDWATSTIAMGRVEQFKREGKQLPPGCGVDAEGRPTTDPFAIRSLLPFGAHKGYGLSLLNELYGAAIGGGLPTVRGRAEVARAAGEKATSAFYFQVVHPEALSGRNFGQGRGQMENIAAVVADILGHGNEGCMLPGTIEAQAAAKCEAAGGLLFSEAEVRAFGDLAAATGQDAGVWEVGRFAVYEG